MTIEEVRAMSDEELRSRIGAICEWKERRAGDSMSGIFLGWYRGELWSCPEETCFDLPNYPCSLDAMEAAEAEFLGDDRIDTYVAHLQELGDHSGYLATPKQRAQAFILTEG
jgi:hypothetical protein